MPEHRFHEEIFDDLEIKKEIIARFNTLRLFSEISGVNYRVLYNVVNQKPCSTEQIREVQAAWLKYDFAMVDARFNEIDALLTKKGIAPSHVEWLYGIYLDYRSAISQTND